MHSLSGARVPRIVWLGGAVVGVGVAVELTRSFWAFAWWYWGQTRHRRQEEGGLRELVRRQGPPPVPLWGNSRLLLRRGYYRTLHRYCMERPVGVFWVGRSPFVVVSDERLVQRVLASAAYVKPRYFGYRSRAMKMALEVHRASERVRVLAEGKRQADAEDNAANPTRRALIALMEQSTPDMFAASMQLLGELERAPLSPEGDFAAVQAHYVRLNCWILFRMRLTATEARRIAHAISGAGDEFSLRMVTPYRGWFHGLANLRYFSHIVTILRFGRRLAAQLDRTAGTWVHAWVGRVGRIGKLGKVLGLLMAATQTVPVAAIWTLHLVSSHDRVRQRLQEEIRECMERDRETRSADGSVDDTAANASDHSANPAGQSLLLTAAQLRHLPYADAVIRESLRLYPPFPILQRQAVADDQLGEVFIPAGQVVSVVPWVMHHHPAYWRDVEHFEPERFLGDDRDRHGDAPSDYCYVPFARGQRMCAGSSLALAELKVLLVCAVLRWGEWTSVQPGTGREVFPGGGVNGAAESVHFPPLSMKPLGIGLRPRHPRRDEESLTDGDARR